MAKSSHLYLDHSWPLWEHAEHFELGHILNSAITDGLPPGYVGALGAHHAGLWECDLADNKLTWSGGVYDIFGVPRGSMIKRDEAVTFYSESSRAAMERLRRYAIRHKRGFTLDVEICTAGVGNSRKVRLIAAPVCDEGGRPVRLHGVKLLL